GSPAPNPSADGAVGRAVECRQSVGRGDGWHPSCNKLYAINHEEFHKIFLIINAADYRIYLIGRVSLGLPTQAATAAEAHNRLMLTKALDLSAKHKAPVKLPLEPEQGRAAA
ncbi:MAG TPA: hypothetical protein VEK75_14820, partial [Xanthobacteraceae bacterium]|nr:hypothetical protein [Xanthobacteraceae bacterium]